MVKLKDRGKCSQKRNPMFELYSQFITFLYLSTVWMSKTVQPTRQRPLKRPLKTEFVLFGKNFGYCLKCFMILLPFIPYLPIHLNIWAAQYLKNINYRKSALWFIVFSITKVSKFIQWIPKKRIITVLINILLIQQLCISPSDSFYFNYIQYCLFLNLTADILFPYFFPPSPIVENLSNNLRESKAENEKIEAETTSPKIPINVVVFGLPLDLHMEESALVKDVKAEILSLFYYPIDIQRLYFKTKNLENDKPLSAYNISPHCTIRLHIALYGGGANKSKMVLQNPLIKDIPANIVLQSPFLVHFLQCPICNIVQRNCDKIQIIMQNTTIEQLGLLLQMKPLPDTVKETIKIHIDERAAQWVAEWTKIDKRSPQLIKKVICNHFKSCKHCKTKGSCYYIKSLISQFSKEILEKILFDKTLKRQLRAIIENSLLEKSTQKNDTVTNAIASPTSAWPSTSFAAATMESENDNNTSIHNKKLTFPTFGGSSTSASVSSSSSGHHDSQNEKSTYDNQICTFAGPSTSTFQIQKSQQQQSILFCDDTTNAPQKSKYESELDNIIYNLKLDEEFQSKSSDSIILPKRNIKQNSSSFANSIPVSLTSEKDTCHLSTAIHILFTIPEFITTLLQWNHALASHTLAYEMKNLLLKCQNKDTTRDTTYQTIVRKTEKGPNSKRPGQMAEDLREYLNTMIHLVSKATCEGSTSETYLQKFQTGDVTKYYKCNDCSNISTEEDGFTKLHLPLNNATTIEQTIVTSITSTKTTLYYTCKCCGRKDSANATEYQKIDRFPKILILDLARNVSKYKKITTPITFPDYLNLQPIIDSPQNDPPAPQLLNCTTSGKWLNCSPNDQRIQKMASQNDNIYELIAVSNHDGYEYYLHHYFAHVKKGLKWFKCEHEKVEQIPPTEVESSDRSAHLLIYRQVDVIHSTSQLCDTDVTAKIKQNGCRPPQNSHSKSCPTAVLFLDKSSNYASSTSSISSSTSNSDDTATDSEYSSSESDGENGSVSSTAVENIANAFAVLQIREHGNRNSSEEDAPPIKKPKNDTTSSNQSYIPTNENKTPTPQIHGDSNNPITLSDEELNNNKLLPSLKEQLEAQGLTQVTMKSDYNCFYRSLSYVLYGNPNQHAELRKETVKYIKSRKSEYEHLITGEGMEWNNYLKSQSTVGDGWGGPVELKAFTEKHNVKVTIYSETNPPQTHGPPNATQNYSIVHVRGNHYNAAVPVETTAKIKSKNNNQKDTNHDLRNNATKNAEDDYYTADEIIENSPIISTKNRNIQSEETKLIDMNTLNIKKEPSSDNSENSDVEILNEESIRLTQINPNVIELNKRKEPITEKELDTIMKKHAKPDEADSQCYLLTFKSWKVEELLDNAFYYGFTTRELSIRLNEHKINAKRDKNPIGPLVGFTDEQMDQVIIIGINKGKYTVNRILEATLIKLQAELSPVVNNIAYEIIDSAEIQHLINLQSNQRDNIIQILQNKIERAIENYVATQPLITSHDDTLPSSKTGFEQFLDILMDNNYTPSQRLLRALDFEHPWKEGDRPHHCYGVAFEKHDANDTIKQIIYFGETMQQLQTRRNGHNTKSQNSAIYDDLQGPYNNNLVFIQLLWEKTNAAKAKDLEAIQIYLGLKRRLPQHFHLRNRLPLEPIRSHYFKKVLINQKHKSQLDIIIRGIMENISNAVNRCYNAKADNENLEFIWFPCQWHFPNGDRCTYAAARTDTLQIHERVHTGERPYACRYRISDTEACTYAAKHLITLQVHERVHTGERPYACRYRISDTEACTFAAVNSSNLLVHERVHTGERPYACRYRISETEICTYAAARTDTLQIHERVHTGERPYACRYRISETEVCTYAAARSDALQIHERVHTGERPYACTLPGCTFTTGVPANLSRHKQNHTGKKFTCKIELADGSICNTPCSRSDALKRHMRQQHNIQ